MGWFTDSTYQIRFDETSQFSDGSANVSVTKFVIGLHRVGHPFLTRKFQDISRTFSGHFCIFQGQQLLCQRHDMQ